MHFSQTIFSNTINPLLYLDPGSGSLLVQLLIAAFLGLGVLIRSQWARIKRWFGGKPKEFDEGADGENYDDQR